MTQEKLNETQKIEGVTLTKNVIYDIANNIPWGYTVKMTSSLNEQIETGTKEIKEIDFSIKYLNNFLNFLRTKEMIAGILKVSNENIRNVKWTSVLYEKSISVFNPSRIYVEFEEDDSLNQIKIFAFIERLKRIGIKTILNKKNKSLSLSDFKRHNFNIIKIALKNEEDLDNQDERDKILDMVELSKKYNFKLLVTNVNSNKSHDKIKDMGIELLEGQIFK